MGKIYNVEKLSSYNFFFELSNTRPSSAKMNYKLGLASKTVIQSGRNKILQERNIAALPNACCNIPY